ncbi:hypothetical protein G4G28_10945 [Massilia sp. Dwa41.01b]|uniref:hypothetical protein n=1 Tax=unclassified Massilia TaxID=2609279 RepID=UPI001603DBBC|nr:MULTISPECIES: hypothetical protein [unclassified Massilia]QNA88873.1 hypothetical protein G4G28_10945 [Massilia sp. Dwa41.01b]QNA99766.1 hypothetical protein G4G31_14590 [Massilia sp. Se16.2.3]
MTRVVPLTLEGQRCSVMLVNARSRLGVRISDGTRPAMLEMTTGNEDVLTNWIGGSTTYFARSEIAQYARIAAEMYLNG